MDDNSGSTPHGPSPMRASKFLMYAALIIGVYMGVKISVIAPYLKGLGYTASQYGLFAAISVSTSTVFTLVSGYMSDRIGSRSTLVLGGLMASLAPPLYYLGGSVHLAAAFAVDGAAGGLIWTSQNVLVSRSVREERLHIVYGDLMALSLVGHVLGSALGWAPVMYSRALDVPILEAYRAALLSLTLLPLIGIPLVLKVPERRPKHGARKPSLSILREKPWLAGFLIYNAVIGLGAAMSVHNIDYYFALKYHSTSGGLGTMFAVQSIIMAIAATRLPRASDKLGLIGTFLAFTSPSIPLLILMTLTDNYLLAAALYVIRAVLMNAGYPLLDAFIMKRVPVGERGMASALLNLAWNVPASAGRAIGGWLMDINVELPLRITAVLYTVALAGLYYMSRSRGWLGEGRALNGSQAS